MIRLGSINFINSLPVDYALKRREIPVPSWRWTEGFPTQLNQYLLEDKLDISPVSSLFYAEHQDQFSLLPDLSISSESGVKSVLLFSRVPIRELHHKKVLISSQGCTTPVLLEILLKLKYHLTFEIQRSAHVDWRSSSFQEEAFVLLGDEALKAACARQLENYHGYDLAQEWQEWTGHPFVFALWVARRKYLARYPDRVNEVWASLQESRKWGQAHQSLLVKKAGELTGLSERMLKSYFAELRYDFDRDLQTGFRRYCEYALELNLLKTDSLEDLCLLPQTLNQS